MTKLGDDEALALADVETASLVNKAHALRDQGKGELVTYSRRVFIPLTRLCRDVCGYCTFATTPGNGERAFLPRDQVLEIARAGAAAGCHGAEFILGDKPELRYSAASKELSALSHSTTVSYLASMAELVLEETGLFPHINAGVMGAQDMALLHRVSLSQGLMLGGGAERLCAPGGPHFGSPDRHPAVQFRMIDMAGELKIPFSASVLIGVGETRRERVDTLLAIRDSHRRHGHIQELIIQNFRAKSNRCLPRTVEPPLEEIVWTGAVARLIFGKTMNIQARPNLSRGTLIHLIDAGINDCGGVSPIISDRGSVVANWPRIAELVKDTARSGKTLVERLTIYPEFSLEAEHWVEPALQARVRAAIDSNGFAREDGWSPGTQIRIPAHGTTRAKTNVVWPDRFGRVLDRAVAGGELTEEEIVSLFNSRADRFNIVCEAADDVRRQVNGNVVSYVVTRNINYTNICYFHCQFCAFSKGRRHEHLGGPAYVLDLEEVARRAAEAWERGATEVCLQGGIHPEYTGDSYVDICRAIKRAVPGIHVHAFSPLEVWQGTTTLAIPVSKFLSRLRDAGLGTLPGTAAEILDDEVRRIICPDKLTTRQWFSVVEAAHQLGLKTTATIMFGHVERPVHWARHLLLLRELQRRTGGFTELVPLPFVPMESPIYIRGKARRGPTFREAILLHAVSRLSLNPFFKNIQTSWPKMGRDGAAACLSAGCNDLGGTLMNESISRAAGGHNGEEFSPPEMAAFIRENGRVPLQRTTLYSPAVVAERVAAALSAAPLNALGKSPAIKGHNPHANVTERKDLRSAGANDRSGRPERGDQ